MKSIKLLFAASILAFLPLFLASDHIQAAATGMFEVSGPTILDPSGNKFVVKGVTPIYGPFAGGDYNGSWSEYSLTNNAAILANLRVQWNGVNTVRIFTSGAAANGTGPADWNRPNYRNALWPVIANARAQGFVVLIANSYSSIADTNAWITELADRYKNDPYVWLTPSNEPFCTSPVSSEKANCTGGNSEWAYWRTQTQAQVNLIRSRGFNNPILLNGPNWSWYWNGYAPNYVINDPAGRLIYGVHRYANGNSWNSSEINTSNTAWANYSNTMPIVADEIGNYNGGGQNTGWYQGITDFLASWVNVRGGAGAIAFAHHWSDGNSQTTNGVTPNAWGQWWISHYLAVVNGGSVPAPAASPSPAATAPPKASPSATASPAATAPPKASPVATASPAATAPPKASPVATASPAATAPPKAPPVVTASPAATAPPKAATASPVPTTAPSPQATATPAPAATPRPAPNCSGWWARWWWCRPGWTGMSN